MVNVKNIGKLAAAAGAGAAIGTATVAVIQRAPVVGGMAGGMIGTGIGLLAAMEAGKRIGGSKNAGMAGAVGFLLASGALGALTIGGTASGGFGSAAGSGR